jgi:hypothetical protein
MQLKRWISSAEAVLDLKLEIPQQPAFSRDASM